MSESDLATQYAPPVPPAVRRQAELADEAVRKLQAEQEAAAAEDPDAKPVGEEGVVVPAAPPPAPAAAVVPSDGVPGEPAPSRQQDGPPADGWEQRYRSLRGKYDKEVPELQGQLRDMQRAIIDMQGQLARPAPAPPPTVVAKTPISDEDIEAYGPELIDRARAWARAELMPEIDQLRHDVVRANGTAQNAATQTAMQGVYKFMDENLASWNEINNAPEFHTWLRATDPLSGAVRQDMLTAAFTQGDARRTLSFFRAFQNEHTADHFRPAPAQTPGGAGGTRLEDLAGPGRGAPASPGAPAAKRFFTQKDVADFYSAVTKGRYAGREAEKDRLEAELHAAVTEGRVRI